MTEKQRSYNHPNRHKAIYATRDYEQTGPHFGRVRQDAEIIKFATEAAAHEWLLAAFSESDRARVTVQRSTEWGDCWIKSVDRPRVGTPWIAPFSYSQLYIQGPGEHPGGRFYWITPSADISILVATEASEPEEC